MSENRVQLPREVDIDKCIALGAVFTRARIDIDELPRFKESCVKVVSDVLCDVRFESDLNDMRVVIGHVDCDVSFVCQRCGNEYVEHLMTDFTLSPDWERAKACNLENKYDFIELNDAGKLDLYNLIEDSLILEIPAFP